MNSLCTQNELPALDVFKLAIRIPHRRSRNDLKTEVSGAVSQKSQGAVGFISLSETYLYHTTSYYSAQLCVCGKYFKGVTGHRNVFEVKAHTNCPHLMGLVFLDLRSR